MSIFKRSSGDAQKTSVATKSETTAEQTARPMSPPPPFMPPGVVPPPAAPVYSMRPAESATRGDGQGSVAERVRLAREAQQRAQASIRERVQRAVQRTPTSAPPTRRLASRQAMSMTRTATQSGARCSHGPLTHAQAGLLNLAWSWQEAGAPIRAIHAYMELLARYPHTPAAAAAVTDLVELSEKLVEDGQFHTALAIYDRLEELE